MIFYLGAVILVVLMTWRGWRLGLVRQALSIVSLAAGYVAGWLLGRFLIPVLRPIGFPDRVLAVIGATLIGLVVYVTLTIVAAVIFKRTSQQSVGLVRWGFGAAGALLGAIFGVFLVLMCVVAIRLAGSLTDVEPGPHHRAPPPTRLAATVARMKKSIEHGPVGAVIEKIDPVPGKIYDTLGKVGEMVNSPDSIDRFSRQRDVQHVSVHPKIAALRNDPEVERALREGDFFALLRNPKVIDAANDPEVLKLLGKFDLQKALDQALRPPQKTPAR